MSALRVGISGCGLIGNKRAASLGASARWMACSVSLVFDDVSEPNTRCTRLSS